jgi:hypothetical protein
MMMKRLAVIFAPVLAASLLCLAAARAAGDELAVLRGADDGRSLGVRRNDSRLRLGHADNGRERGQSGRDSRCEY